MAATSASSSTLGQILNIHISHSGEEGNSKMSELYNTLIKDHDIQSLSLKVANHGCITSGNPFAFSFQLGDSFSPLATLRLDGYDFDSLHDARSTWYRLSTTGIHGWRRYITHEYSYEWLRPERIPLNIDKRCNLRLSKSAMDWSRLERLELANVHLPVFSSTCLEICPESRSWRCCRNGGERART